MIDMLQVQHLIHCIDLETVDVAPVQAMLSISQRVVCDIWNMLKAVVVGEAKKAQPLDGDLQASIERDCCQAALKQLKCLLSIGGQTRRRWQRTAAALAEGARIDLADFCSDVDDFGASRMSIERRPMHHHAIHGHVRQLIKPKD